jgi:hypothetical protein
MIAGVAHKQDRENQPKSGIGDAEQEWCRPQPVALGDVAGQEGSDDSAGSQQSLRSAACIIDTAGYSFW